MFCPTLIKPIINYIINMNKVIKMKKQTKSSETDAVKQLNSKLNKLDKKIDVLYERLDGHIVKIDKVYSRLEQHFSGIEKLLSFFKFGK